jgi:hypothetical protein
MTYAEINVSEDSIPNPEQAGNAAIMLEYLGILPGE